MLPNLVHRLIVATLAHRLELDFFLPDRLIIDVCYPRLLRKCFPLVQ
jgi:hypothetical protein